MRQPHRPANGGEPVSVSNFFIIPLSNPTFQQPATLQSHRFVHFATAQQEYGPPEAIAASGLLPCRHDPPIMALGIAQLSAAHDPIAAPARDLLMHLAPSLPGRVEKGPVFLSPSMEP
jgi:hypothetical protein